MNFVDIYDENPFDRIDSDSSQLLSEAIKSVLGLVDKDMNQISKNEEQIRFFVRFDQEDAIRMKNLYECENLYFNAEGHFLLHFCDLMTAYRYLITTTNGWDFRFFMRRIYTLLHETRHSSLNLVGANLKHLEKLIDPTKLEAFKQSKHELDRFFNNNDDAFIKIRNTCEAHKDKRLLKQLEVLHDFNMKNAFDLLAEAIRLIRPCLVNLASIDKDIISRMSKISDGISAKLQIDSN